MTKIMISQPMRGKTNEEIKKEREALIFAIENAGGEYLDSVLDISEERTPLFYLSKSIAYLDEADVIYFMPGWEKARGCKIEFECAKAYGKFIKCVDEEEMQTIKEGYEKSKGNKKTIKIKFSSLFNEKVKDEDLDKDMKKFKTDLEEMLNDFAEKRES